MGITLPNINFSKGEVAPALYGRIDVSAYQAGLKKCRNFVVQRTGGVSFRPGTRLVGKIDDPTKEYRLAPFQFSIDQAYALLLQQGSMRPMALGGFVLEQDTKITSATQSNPCSLTIPFHGYSVGDRVYITGVEGMVELNNRFVTVLTVPDADHITIDVDARNFSAFVSSAGTLNTTAPTPPPPPVVVPPPYVPPAPPSTGGGGGNYQGPSLCVAANRTLIRMANFSRNGPGPEKLARYVRVGEWVWTQHEHTLEWGAFEVVASEYGMEECFRIGGFPHATANHRFWIDGWKFARDLGEPDGKMEVWKGTVAGAHTYLSRSLSSKRWVLSHNIKSTTQNEDTI